jgi:hypothetical protein
VYRIVGRDSVYEDFSKQAVMKFGGKIVCKDLHVFAGQDIGCTICIEQEKICQLMENLLK